MLKILKKYSCLISVLSYQSGVLEAVEIFPDKKPIVSSCKHSAAEIIKDLFIGALGIKGLALMCSHYSTTRSFDKVYVFLGALSLINCSTAFKRFHNKWKCPKNKRDYRSLRVVQYLFEGAVGFLGIYYLIEEYDRDSDILTKINICNLWMGEIGLITLGRAIENFYSILKRKKDLKKGIS